MTTQTQGEVFTGKSGQMRVSPWLSSEDIMGLGDVELTIKAVYRHKDVEFEFGRKKPEVFALEFEGRQRQLVLNSTNRRALVKLCGTNDVKQWAGKKVTLFVDPEVKVKGVKVGGIRIRL